AIRLAVDSNGRSESNASVIRSHVEDVPPHWITLEINHVDSTTAVSPDLRLDSAVWHAEGFNHGCRLGMCGRGRENQCGGQEDRMKEGASCHLKFPVQGMSSV